MIEIGSANTNLTLRPSGYEGARNDGRVLAHGRNESEQVATVEMSFEDVLDAINPLQHVPVLSSIYRAISGEEIHPVSRIAGDALYGGILGLASAGIALIGAIGDEIIAANNEGQNSAETMLASLFETPKENTASEQSLARNTDTTPNTAPIYAQNTPQEKAALATTATTETPLIASKHFPIDRPQLPSEGNINTAAIQAPQPNNMPLIAPAIASKDTAFKAQRSLRNSRFEVANAETATAKPAKETGYFQADPQTQEALQKLILEIQSTKGANQYNEIYKNTPIPAGNINIVN